MTERTLLIQPRDPVIFRDGKPFTMGLPARSVDWPLPSAVIGAIRTRLGRNTRYDTATVERLKLIEHEGPFLVARGEKGDALAFPAPADAVAFSPALRSNERGETPLELCRLRPARLAAHEGTNLPGEYAPLMGALNEKPAGTPPFWSVDATLSWLADGGNDSLFRSNRELGFGRLSRQRRTHVQINAARQAAEDGALFATEGLEFSEYRRREGVAGFEDPNPRICSRIRHPEDDRWADLEALAPIGGERRLAYWSEGEIQWPAPEKLPPDDVQAVADHCAVFQRTVGDVLVDQISHYHRVGFDAFLPDQAITLEAVDKAIHTWPQVYQRTVDGRAPIWALRHG